MIMNLTTGQRIDEAKRLLAQTKVPYTEETMAEVEANDQLFDSIKELLVGFPECVQKAVYLNHI